MFDGRPVVPTACAVTKFLGQKNYYETDFFLYHYNINKVVCSVLIMAMNHEAIYLYIKKGPLQYFDPILYDLWSWPGGCEPLGSAENAKHLIRICSNQTSHRAHRQQTYCIYTGSVFVIYFMTSSDVLRLSDQIVTLWQRATVELVQNSRRHKVLSNKRLQIRIKRKRSLRASAQRESSGVYSGKTADVNILKYVWVMTWWLRNYVVDWGSTRCLHLAQ